MEFGFRSGSPTDRILPDPAVCAARTSGFGEYADCLVDHPHGCQHALPFGWGFLCRHPQQNEIVKRTAEQASGPGERGAAH